MTPENVASITGAVRAFKSEETLRHPATGVQATFSYHHSMAVALVDGAAFPAQYSDEKSNDPSIAAVRDKIEVIADPSLPRGVAAATVKLNDGRSYKEVLEHPTGSPERPMSDAQVEAKFRALTAGALATSRSERLLEACWQIDRLADLRDLVDLWRVDGNGEQMSQVA